MMTVSARTSAAELQAMIDSARAGETIKLEAGTFTFDRTVVIDRDDITVMGAGSGATAIQLTSQARSGGAFKVGDAFDHPQYLKSSWLDRSASEGAKSLHLSDASGIKAGDHLWVELPNTSAYFNSIGDYQWREVKPLRTTLVEVAAVNGNSVRLVNSLGFDFTPGTSVRLMDVTENVRLGGFSIDSGLYASPGEFRNRLPEHDRANVISVSATSHVQLSDIAIENAPSNGITVSRSAFLEARNIAVDGSVNKGEGGNGYAFQLRGVYDSNLTGLEAYDTRHAVVFASWTSEVNNKVHVTHTNRDINFHGGPDHGNVVEVLRSSRTETEARYLSPTFFVNEGGTNYGAPTEADVNDVSFRFVTGTVRSDHLIGGDTGVEFHAREGRDTLIGGAGDDLLYADEGNDRIYGSAGNDRIDGGIGDDVLVYAADRSAYSLTRGASGEIIVRKPGGEYDRVTGDRDLPVQGRRCVRQHRRPADHAFRHLRSRYHHRRLEPRHRARRRRLRPHPLAGEPHARRRQRSAGTDRHQRRQRHRQRARQRPHRQRRRQPAHRPCRRRPDLRPRRQRHPPRAATATTCSTARPATTGSTAAPGSTC